MVAVSLRFTIFVYYCALVALNGMVEPVTSAVIPGYRRSGVVSSRESFSSGKALSDQDQEARAHSKKKEEKKKKQKALNHHPDQEEEGDKDVTDEGIPKKKPSRGKKNQATKTRPAKEADSEEPVETPAEDAAEEQEVVKRLSIGTMNSMADRSVGIFGRRTERFSDLNFYEHGSQHHFDVAQHPGILSSRAGSKNQYRRDQVDGQNAIEFREVERREQAGVPGRVDIMSSGADSDVGRRVASLCLTDEFTLNACEKNETVVHLVPVSSASAPSFAASEGHQQVMLQVSVYDPKQVAMTSYCATFDPSPQESKPLTMEPCYASTSSPEKPHKSQQFDYEESTNIIQPMQHRPQQEATTASTAVTTREDVRSLTMVFVPEAPVAAKQETQTHPTTISTPTPPPTMHVVEAMLVSPSETGLPPIPVIIKGQAVLDSSLLPTPTFGTWTPTWTISPAFPSLVHNAEAVASQIANRLSRRNFSK